MDVSPASASATAAMAAAAALAGIPVRAAAWVLFSCLLALLMAVRGYRKRSLSASGAAAAFVVGSLTMSAGPRFGVTLIAFYLSSSSLTRLGTQHKRRVEDRFKEGGQRDGWQVLSNSVAATTVALLFLLLISAPSSSSSSSGIASLPDRWKLWLGGLSGSGGGKWEVVERDEAGGSGGKGYEERGWGWEDRCWVGGGGEQQRWERMLLAAFLAHYAACAGDTWSSEIGILSKDAPRLITTLQRVPRGTNGGVSLMGLGAAAAGGAFMGAVFLSSGLLSTALCSSNTAHLSPPLPLPLLTPLSDHVTAYDRIQSTAVPNSRVNSTHRSSHPCSDLLPDAASSDAGNTLASPACSIDSGATTLPGQQEGKQGEVECEGQGHEGQQRSLRERRQEEQQQEQEEQEEEQQQQQRWRVVWLQALAVPLGLLAGLLGSLLDSVLGATLQYSGFCQLRKKVVTAPAPSVKHISGLRLLTNDAVNCISALIMALVAAAAMSRL